MRKLEAVLFCLVGALLCLGIPGTGRAADISKVKIEVPAGGVFTEANGTVSMQFKVTNESGQNLVVMDAVVPDPDSIVAIAELDGFEPHEIANGQAVWLDLTATLKSGASAGEHYVSPGGGANLSFRFNLPDDTVVGSVYPQSPYTIVKTTSPTPSPIPAPTVTPEPDKEIKLRLSTVDQNGQNVLSPSGDYGDAVTVRIPLMCQNEPVQDIKLTPVLSNEVEKYPFDIDEVDYTLHYTGILYPRQIMEFSYFLTISKQATVGVKKVDYTVTYRTLAGVLETGTISVYLDVVRGLPPTGEPTPIPATPRLIIESYTITPDKIYAGETFNVEFTLRNTSGGDAIQNLQVHVKDTTGETPKVVPASGGSNTLYIQKIGKGDANTQKIAMQTAPDTEAKAYTLTLDFSYESGDHTAYTASEVIAVPILQRLRIKMDDPTVYDEAWVNQSCAMNFNMYNMGKSTVYNCMLDVEGEGLSMEETYFGGNVAAGATMRADFNIIPATAGEIDATLLVSYEDVYGETTVERIPFKLTVNEEIVPEMPPEDMIETEPGATTGFPWWGWTLGGVGVAGGGTAAVLGARKRRKARTAELSDV